MISANLSMRAVAQLRFTAVGRAASSFFLASRNAPSSAVVLPAAECPSARCAAHVACAAMAMPNAPVTPIAGAPRTAMVAIASCAASTVRISRYLISCGSSRWSISRMHPAPESNSTVRVEGEVLLLLLLAAAAMLGGLRVVFCGVGVTGGRCRIGNDLITCITLAALGLCHAPCRPLQASLYTVYSVHCRGCVRPVRTSEL